MLILLFLNIFILVTWVLFFISSQGYICFILMFSIFSFMLFLLSKVFSSNRFFLKNFIIIYFYILLLIFLREIYKIHYSLFFKFLVLIILIFLLFTIYFLFWSLYERNVYFNSTIKSLNKVILPVFIISLSCIYLILSPVVLISYFLKIRFYTFIICLLFSSFILYFSYLLIPVILEYIESSFLFPLNFYTLIILVISGFLFSPIYCKIVSPILVFLSLEIPFFLLKILIIIISVIIFHLTFSIVFIFIFVSSFNKYLSLSFSNTPSKVKSVSFKRSLSMSSISSKTFRERLSEGKNRSVIFSYYPGFKDICSNFNNLVSILEDIEGYPVFTGEEDANKCYYVYDVKRLIYIFTRNFHKEVLNFTYISGCLVWKALIAEGYSIDLLCFLRVYFAYHLSIWTEIGRNSRGKVCYISDLYFNLSLDFWRSQFNSDKVGFINSFITSIEVKNSINDFKLGIGIIFLSSPYKDVNIINKTGNISQDNIMVVLDFIHVWEDQLNIFIVNSRKSLLEFKNLSNYDEVKFLAKDIGLEDNFSFYVFIEDKYIIKNRFKIIH